MKITHKDPTLRHKFRKFMKKVNSKRKLKFLRKMKVQYDIMKKNKQWI